MIKTDLAEEWPPIWRVDGKTLLQKYEPFEHEGEMLYRNISTVSTRDWTVLHIKSKSLKKGKEKELHEFLYFQYSGWPSENKNIYRPIAVRLRLQNKSETLVEFLKDEMVEDDE